MRGLTPWPGAYSSLGGKLLKISRVACGVGSGTPGTLLRVGRDGIEVACRGGSVLIQELQLEGKRRMAAGEFLAGHPLEPGMLLGQEGGPL